MTRIPGHIETAVERDLRAAAVVQMARLKKPHETTINEVYDVQLEGGLHGIFKPASGEVQTARPIARGTYYRREVAAFRLDRLLGCGLVPETVFKALGGGPGSLQAFAPFDGWLTYPPVDVAKLAVLDYVSANTDRHAQNMRTTADGRVAAIDNGLCFPRDNSHRLKSRHVRLQRYQYLPKGVVAAVRLVEPADVVAILRKVRIEEDAVQATVERLLEIQREGRITGDAWGGRIEAA